jgi:hypothetical protein
MNISAQMINCYTIALSKPTSFSYLDENFPGVANFAFYTASNDFVSIQIY